MELVTSDMNDTSTGGKLMNHSINYSGFIDLIKEYSREEHRVSERQEKKELVTETNIEEEQAIIASVEGRYTSNCNVP